MEKNVVASHIVKGQGTTTAPRFVQWLKGHPLTAFFLLAFGITWAGWFLLLALQSGILPFKLDPDSLTATLMFRLSGWGPTISAIVLTALISGKKGMRDFFSRLVLWRVGIRWYAAALFVVPTIFLVVMACYVLMGGTLTGNPYLSDWYLPILLFLPAVFVSLVKAAIAEEPGWRGYALPQFLTRHNALIASIFLGLLWGLWHLPIYILDPANNPISSFFLLLPQAVALSILYTWGYVHTKRSTLISILFHSATDGAWVLLFGGITDLQGNILLTGGMLGAALIVLAIFGPQLSSRPQENEYIDGRIAR